MDIVINNICKSFGDKVVLNNFNAKFPCNKKSSIMAPSGKGKTTLLKIILGLISADTGNIDGIEDKKIVAVFQEDRLCENLSAVVNISIATGVSKQRIVSSLKEIGLEGSTDAPVSTLSGGMKRRVAILRAILADADIILLDEPFKGLDDDTKQDVIALVNKYTVGKTVLLVTHQAQEIFDLGCLYSITM